MVSNDLLKKIYNDYTHQYQSMEQLVHVQQMQMNERSKTLVDVKANLLRLKDQLTIKRQEIQNIENRLKAVETTFNNIH
jgi:chromosome segregation ATPase